VARNVEVKARLADLDAARAVAARLGATCAWTDVQVDRYYELDGARRLKLRTCGRGPAELIRYDRPEATGVRTSEYEVSPVRDAAAEACLVPKMPPLVTVRKRRELWQLDNVRIHLDDVDGLGTFLELEAVVDAAHDEVACERSVRCLLDALGLRETDCLRASYSDLLRA
jgi:predicted adenylyl cyclase CyaB